MTKTRLELYADPLGDLYVEWQIPLSFVLSEIITIDLPTYKYEMSVFSGIPIPFSSIAESIDCEVFKVTLDNDIETGRISYKRLRDLRGVIH